MASPAGKQSRPKLIQVLFRALDDNGSGRLSAKQLRRFTECCGFSGSSEDWAHEFSEVCKLYGWDPRAGPDLAQFARLVNDKSGIGYNTDAELGEIVAQLTHGGAHKQDLPRAQNAGPRSPAQRPASAGATAASGGSSRQCSASPRGQRSSPHREPSAPASAKQLLTSSASQQRPATPERHAGGAGRGPLSPGRDVGTCHSSGTGGGVAVSPRWPGSPSRSAPAEAPDAAPSAAVLGFIDWVAGQWEKIHNLFTLEDRTQYVVKGTIGRRGLSAMEWVRKLRELGFTGNSRAVFDEINAECRNEKEDRRRDLTIGRAANRSARVTIFAESISLAQVMRFQTRMMAVSARLAASADSSPAGRFTRLLLQKRGSLLRAWRMDLDIRGSGRIAYVDFAHACRGLGVANQARPIWSTLRQKEDSRPLEFDELAPEEGANLEAFVETLWNSLGFDLEKAWNILDTNCQKWLSLEEFEAGARKLGFEGNTRLLFRGLDTSGLGRVWHNEFEYIKLVTRVGPRRLQLNSGPLTDLIQWVKRRLGSVDELIRRLGLTGENREIATGDLVVRLAALGFDGDALQAASQAARQDGGTKISADTLVTLFSADLASSRLSATQRLRTSPLTSRTGFKLGVKQVWNDTLEDTTALNLTKPKGVRNYFSVPGRDEGFCPPQRRPCGRSASAGRGLHGRPTEKPCWNPGFGSPMSKPAWNDNVAIVSDINLNLPASNRMYFSDASEKPVREAMRSRLQKSHSAEAFNRVAPKPGSNSDSSPLERFARFAVSRFGSPGTVFRKLDVDGSGFLKHRDFNLQVQRAGYTENPNPVFQRLDRYQRGAVSLREFTVGMHEVLNGEEASMEMY